MRPSHRASAVAATLVAIAVCAEPAQARDVYRNFLDQNIPRHKAALDILEQLKKAPNDAGLHNDLGCLVALDGFWRDALREFETAADLDRKDGKPYFNAGLVHIWKTEWRSARRAFRSAVDRDPGMWRGWWFLGLAEERLGKTEAAVEAYKTSLRLDTSLFDPRVNPYALDSRLKARVLIETLEKRRMKAVMLQSEAYTNPAIPKTLLLPAKIPDSLLTPGKETKVAAPSSPPAAAPTPAAPVPATAATLPAAPAPAAPAPAAFVPAPAAFAPAASAVAPSAPAPTPRLQTAEPRGGPAPAPTPKTPR